MRRVHARHHERRPGSNAWPLLAGLVGLLLLWFAQPAPAADSAPFDLAGPELEVRVQRGGASLPIAEVPHLQEGDQLRLKALLPRDQSARYLLVVAFLRGATNPPPEEWFMRCETWRGCGAKGLEVKVPAGARQVLVFLAPSTGGDWRTLVGAVLGRPGAFVRTSQDLDQAMLDRARLDAWLEAVQHVAAQDPSHLHAATPLIARSLGVRLDEKCLERPLEQQAACLAQGRETLILNDGHSTSIVAALTQGPASDLATAASMTPEARSGYYGPYVASIMDIARIFETMRTAQFQYLPALGIAHGERLALRLNAVPSFHEPKSVLVSALPAVEAAQPPPLRVINPQEAHCIEHGLVQLPVSGAPLVFATQFAHDLALRVELPDATPAELPVHADAVQGALVVDATQLHVTGSRRLRARVHGAWGFEPFEGPQVELVTGPAPDWRIAAPDQSGVVIGRPATVHLLAAWAGCLDSVLARDAAGNLLPVTAAQVAPGEAELHVGLEQAEAGPIRFEIHQAGDRVVGDLTVNGFTEPGHLELFALHRGDTVGVLRGSRLDQVESLELGDLHFTPGALVRRDGHDELSLESGSTPGDAPVSSPVRARVRLRDGRTLEVLAQIELPRPAARLLSRNVEALPTGPPLVHLAGAEALPAGARVRFSLHTVAPSRWTRNSRVEVATEDESASVSLAVRTGTLVLEDPHVAVATLDTAQAFDASVFGPLKFRLVIDEVAGDWKPLGVLVRLPQLARIDCPPDPATPCTLAGERLFLIDAVSADAGLSEPVKVEEGFAGTRLAVPHPRGGHLYLRLRDEPQRVDALELPVSAESAAAPVEPDRARTVPIS